MSTITKTLEPQEKRKRGRPRSFDRNAVLKMAMDKFWEQGYNKVSINELAEDTGITRASIYNSFISKENLLLESLNFYLKDSPDVVLFSTNPGDSVTEAFASLFKTVCECRSNDNKKRGCFAVNSLLELSTRDDYLGKCVKDLFDKRRKAAKSLIQLAVEQGELKTIPDYDAHTDLFMTFLYGLNVYAKTNNTEKTLWQLCHSFLVSFGFDLPSSAAVH